MPFLKGAIHHTTAKQSKEAQQHCNYLLGLCQNTEYLNRTKQKNYFSDHYVKQRALINSRISIPAARKQQSGVSIKTNPELPQARPPAPSAAPRRPGKPEREHPRGHPGQPLQRRCPPAATPPPRPRGRTCACSARRSSPAGDDWARPWRPPLRRRRARAGRGGTAAPAAPRQGGRAAGSRSAATSTGRRAWG